MCDDRDGKFVVQESAGMGWWIGHVLGTNGNYLQINVLWTQKPDRKPSEVVISTKKYVTEFDDPTAAMEFLASKGIVASV